MLIASVHTFFLGNVSHLVASDNLIYASDSQICSFHPNFSPEVQTQLLLTSHLNVDFYFIFSTSKTQLIFHSDMLFFLFLPAPLIILSNQVKSSKVTI